MKIKVALKQVLGKFLDILTFGKKGDPPLFVSGDVEGFFMIFFNNFLNLSITYSLLVYVIQYDPNFVNLRVLPAMGYGVIFGSLFYWWQARRKAKKEKRSDVCALPFGVSAPSLFAFAFFIIMPEKLLGKDGDAFGAGIFASFWGGIIESLTGLYGSFLRNNFPNTALITSLTGIAIALIATGSLYQIFAYPMLSIIPLLLFVFSAAARVEIKLPKCHSKLPAFFLPWGIVIIIVGIIIAWILYAFNFRNEVQFTNDPIAFGFFYPVPCFYELFNSLKNGSGAKYVAVLIPLSVINGVGSLQNLVSAKNRGDDYDTQSTLIINGLSSSISALFGSVFPTTLYIGHPTFKELGARSGYMLLNAIAIWVCVTFGLVQLVLRFVPIAAFLPILVFVGYQMTVEGFFSDDEKGPEASECPRRYHLAVAVGIVPCLANLSVQAVTSTINVVGVPLIDVFERFAPAGYYLSGAISLSQGFLLSSMLTAAVVIYWIDRKYLHAAMCLFVLSFLSWIGIIHSFKITKTGIENVFIGQNYIWIAAPGFALSYALFGIFMLSLEIMSRFTGIWKQGELVFVNNTYQWRYGEENNEKYEEIGDSEENVVYSDEHATN